MAIFATYVAHYLANIALSRISFCDWLDFVPLSIGHYVKAHIIALFNQQKASHLKKKKKKKKVEKNVCIYECVKSMDYIHSFAYLPAKNLWRQPYKNPKWKMFVWH